MWCFSVHFFLNLKSLFLKCKVLSSVYSFIKKNPDNTNLNEYLENLQSYKRVNRLKTRTKIIMLRAQNDCIMHGWDAGLLATRLPQLLHGVLQANWKKFTSWFYLFTLNSSTIKGRLSFYLNYISENNKNLFFISVGTWIV